MLRLRRSGGSHKNQGAIAAIVAFALAATPAAARTATFDSSEPFQPGPMISLSTAGDRAGAFLALNQWISLTFAQPFGVARSDSVSIFTLAPPTGRARFTISIGRYNNGQPVFVDTTRIRAGRVLTINNLFRNGCSALGGCDFILITMTRTRGGAPGGTVDYVSVNGEVTEVTAPTPEPSTWAMMIVGFALVAARLKAQRASSPSSANGALARCSR